MTAAGIRDSLSRAFEPMTSLLSRPRVITLQPDTKAFVLDIERPAMLRMSVVGSSHRNGTGAFILLATPGVTQSLYDDPYQAFGPSGRTFILPWGGRWNLSLSQIGQSVGGGATAIDVFVWEAVPGVTPSDLAHLLGQGCSDCYAIGATTADVGQHTLDFSNPFRRGLMLQNTSGNTFFVTFDATVPSVNNGWTLQPAPGGGAMSQIIFESSIVPLGPVTVVAATAAAARITGYVFY